LQRFRVIPEIGHVLPVLFFAGLMLYHFDQRALAGGVSARKWGSGGASRPGARQRAPTDSAGFDSYVSDPAKPVTDRPRPIRVKGPGSNYDASLVDDQRFAGDRPDVLRYVSAPLTAPLRLAGQPVATLFAATTGSDADWVVKLIDVYPDEVPGEPAMGGFELPIAMAILRGRYRHDFANPSAIPPGSIERYRLRLPHVAHALLPGHRLMVQIQSSWFPLYDRNPQTFVPNIMFANPTDYVAATQQVFRQAGAASCIDLPILP
jgi:putative CocE/NonD family hydrolase